MNEKLPEEIINLIEAAHDHAFEVLVEQSRVNPDAMEALYS